MPDVLVGASLISMVDAFPDAVVRVDEDLRVSYANRAAQRISRKDPDSLNGSTLWELYPEMVGTRLPLACYEAMESGEERDISGFYYEPFETWLDVHIIPMQPGLTIYCRDVSPIKAADRARTAITEQLQEVQDATTDGIVSINRSWRITYLNRRARDLLAPAGDLLGADIWKSFPAQVYEGSPYLTHYHQAMSEGIHGEFESYYRAPLDLWLQISVRPSLDGIIVFFRDVTARKHAEAALVQSEKLAAMGRLASSIAHEINNPLAAVTNLLYLARQSARGIPQVEHYLEEADEQLKRVSLIASQTLRFHRQSTRPCAIGCSELFTTVLAIYEAKLKEQRIKLEKRKRANKPVVCLEGEIRQVLNNLVANAIDAMPAGGRLLVRSREGTDWRTDRKGLVLTVADTGVGVDPATFARIFEAFFTTKGTGGTGLGLWISASIMERHQGRIRVRSGQGLNRSGTVVAMFLPFQTTCPISASSPTIS